MDGVDAALVTFAADGTMHLDATASVPLPDELRGPLLQLTQTGGPARLAQLGTIHQQLGLWFADAALAVMDKAHVGPADIAAIGSHGQTVWHAPDGRLPFSMQLGAASQIAARSGCTVVADFRSADMAAGGQGAPLVPAFHRDMFAGMDSGRIIVNIGGIANLTILPAGANQDDTRIAGFDTGPGNGLMDLWVATHLDAPMDADGRWAASGTIDAGLLRQMLNDPYLHKAPPKSTGREYFNRAWLQARLDNLGTSPAPADVQATLCEFTAQSVVNAINDCGPGFDDIIVCGGGAHNRHLMQRLTSLLAPCRVTTSAAHGIDVDWVEAAAFAWLAMRRLKSLPGNLPSVTGASSPAILGAVHAPPAG